MCHSCDCVAVDAGNHVLPDDCQRVLGTLSPGHLLVHQLTKSIHQHTHCGLLVLTPW